MSKLSLLAINHDRMENIFLLPGYKGSGIKPSLHFLFFAPDCRGTTSVNAAARVAERKKNINLLKVKAGVDFKE